MYGYAGQFLRVNLSTQKVSKEPLSAELARSYIGGAPLACYLLYKEVPPKADPLGPENKLILMTGPLTGSEVPGAVKYCLVTKSPVNGFPAESDASGSLGRLLKFAGYDGMIIEGKASSLSYIYIQDDKVELHDAPELAGKDVYETVDFLQARHGASAEVGCTGPAADNLVRFSGFLAEKEHSASKGGMGAAIGGKKLKSIVVKASGRSLPVHDNDALAKVLGQWKKIDDKLGLGKTVSVRGMRGGYEDHYIKGIVPVKNLTTNDWDEFQGLTYENVSKCFEIYRNSCPTCNFNHFNRFIHNGQDLKEPSFDTLVGYGPNLGFSSPVDVVRLITLADRLGLETQETSWLISFLMECFQDGLIGSKELDGLCLSWGDYEAVSQLMRKIAYREGCGSWLADGIYRAAQKLGPKALEKAVYSKNGFVPQLMDNRNDWAFALGEAFSNVGHFQGAPDNTGKTPVEKMAERQAKGVASAQARDSLGLCFLHGATNNIELSVAALNAVTGMGFSIQEFLDVGLRSITQMRLYAIRCGHKKEDDCLSPRYLSAPGKGFFKGKALGDYFPQIREEYYRLMGWDEQGVPLPATLKKLGLQ